MRITLLHNPRAGDEQFSAEVLKEELAEAGHEVTYQSTKKKKLDKALQDPGDLIVVAGGDGTVKKVATRLAGTGIPMAILPLGTANNIAKSLGVLGSARELIAGWERAERRKLDVGVVEAPWGEARFVESVGGGLFAQLIRRGEDEVDENLAGLTGNETDRALQLLMRILETYPPRRWRLTLDGRDISGEYLLVEAMNIRFIGPTVPLAPTADPGDGWLDVVTVTAAERDACLAYVAGRLEGAAVLPALTVRRGRRLRLVLAERELHVDDALWPEHEDAAEDSPARRGARREVVVRLQRGALEVLVGRA